MSSTTLRFHLSLLLNAALLTTLSSSAAAFNTSDMESLKSGVASWNSMRADHKEYTPDLSGADLKGRKLKGIDLHNANLSGTILSQSDLSNANLQNASLNNARLNGSMLIKANLERAMLRGANLEGAMLDGANFHEAALEQAIIKKADCSNANMSDADLRNCNFREATLVNANLSGADLRGIYLWRANLSRARINGVKVSENSLLESGKFASRLWAEKHDAFFISEHQSTSSTNSVKAVPSEQKKDAIILPLDEDVHSKEQKHDDNTLGKSDSSSPAESVVVPRNMWSQDGPINVAYDKIQYQQLKTNVFAWNDMRKRNSSISIELNKAPLDHKNLSYANLNHAKLSESSFRGTDMSNSNLQFADLRGCDLQEANLEHADLGGADLKGANLWRANLDRARLTGAIVSNKTVLNSGRKATQESAESLGMKFTAE